MQRVTVTLDDNLVSDLDTFMHDNKYASRSEALRDLARSGLRQSKISANPESGCIAAIVYTYDHHAREISKNITQSHHDHHDMIISSLHVHINSEKCLEISVLKGMVKEVKHFASHLISQRHVKNGNLIIIPADHYIEE